MLLVPRRARNRRAAVRILTSLSNRVCSAADTQKRNSFYVAIGSQIVRGMGRFFEPNDRPECRPQTMNRLLVCDHYKHHHRSAATSWRLGLRYGDGRVNSQLELVRSLAQRWS